MAFSLQITKAERSRLLHSNDRSWKRYKWQSLTTANRVQVQKGKRQNHRHQTKEKNTQPPSPPSPQQTRPPSPPVISTVGSAASISSSVKFRMDSQRRAMKEDIQLLSKVLQQSCCGDPTCCFSTGGLMAQRFACLDRLRQLNWALYGDEEMFW